MIETITVKTLRYKTSDGTHWGTEKEAILHEIECAIGENPAYFYEYEYGNGYDIHDKESMLHFIQHNPGLVKYILGLKKDKYISKIDYKDCYNGITYTKYIANSGQDYAEAVKNAKNVTENLESEKGYLIVNVDIEIIQCLK